MGKNGSTPEDVEGKPYINEGPFALVSDNNLYLAYSTSGYWCVGYCIAFLKLNGNNPLDAKDWIKYDNYTLRDNELAKGCGHCCILKDEDDYRVFFHAWEVKEDNLILSNVELWEGKLIIEANNIKIV